MTSIDGHRLLARLAELNEIGATGHGGVTREAYGSLDVEARTLVAGWMTQAGLTPVVDAAANLIGRRAGAGSTGRCLATGSHLDTVVEAGALDGAYGVVAAVEMAEAIRRSGLALHHDLAVTAFANEEGARGTDGMVGSRALIGEVTDAELASLDDDGVALAERLTAAGGDPGELASAAWDASSVAAFVELHVEQGPVLDTGGWNLGVVTGISGRQAVDIEIIGMVNHAGTTPMDLRADALVAAAEVVLEVEALARERTVRVATCGHLQVRPNVRNVVPGRVTVSAELRDESAESLSSARAVLERVVAAIGARRAIEIGVAWRQYVAPIAADDAVLEAISRAAARSGLPWCSLPSGAGHDAQVLGARVPMGMIFVPSTGGVSHSPGEHTEPAHLVAGAQLLVDSVLELDERLIAVPPSSARS